MIQTPRTRKRFFLCISLACFPSIGCLTTPREELPAIGCQVLGQRQGPTDREPFTVLALNICGDNPSQWIGRTVQAADGNEYFLLRPVGEDLAGLKQLFEGWSVAELDSQMSMLDDLDLVEARDPPVPAENAPSYLDVSATWGPAASGYRAVVLRQWEGGGLAVTTTYARGIHRDFRGSGVFRWAPLPTSGSLGTVEPHDFPLDGSWERVGEVYWDDGLVFAYGTDDSRTQERERVDVELASSIGGEPFDETWFSFFRGGPEVQSEVQSNLMYFIYRNSWVGKWRSITFTVIAGDLKRAWTEEPDADRPGFATYYAQKIARIIHEETQGPQRLRVEILQ